MGQENLGPDVQKERKDLQMDELVQLRELVQELEERLANEMESRAEIMSAYDRALKQQAHFQKLEIAQHESFVVEQKCAAELKAKNTGYMLEVHQLKENLKFSQESLNAERERGKKPECVERGVQCDFKDENESQIRLIDEITNENSESSAAVESETKIDL